MEYLPDDILIHILSFLPMKDAASTSILSKRWRTLFAFTHNLEFDDPFNYPDKWYRWRESQKIFQDFVYRILALQKGSRVEKLSLNLKNSSNNRCINHWIYYALKHGVSTLHICIDRDMRFLSRVFTSNTLVNLSLGTAISIDNVPSDSSFPSLKVLLLDEISFKDDQLSNVFLADCPVLEDLTINYCPNSGTISSKTIKKLKFINNYYEDLDLLFDTPSVVDLYYSNISQFNFSQSCQFDLLVKATLDLEFFSYWYDDSRYEDVKNLITVIRKVKSLHLTISAVKVISVYCQDGLPMFNNLVDLVFSSNKQGLRVLLPRLLECSPNLKRLVLSGLHCYTCQKRRRFVGIRIPVNNKIEMLSIMQYQGNTNELKHLSHILLNMECLKEVKVYVAATMDDPEKMQLTEVLMKLPTASSELKMQVI